MKKVAVLVFAVTLILTGISRAQQVKLNSIQSAGDAGARNAALLPDTYTSLILASLDTDFDSSVDTNVVVSINFNKGDFSISEADSQFLLLTSLLNTLLSSYPVGTFVSVKPSDLISFTGPTAVGIIQGIYQSYGYQLYIVVDVMKTTPSHLGILNERLDIYLDDEGSLMYLGSVEFPMSYISAPGY